jgi:general secretion pathway protein H
MPATNSFLQHCPNENRHDWPACARYCSGFTLVELLVVLVIATLLLTTVPPLLSTGVSSAEVKGAARQLAASLRYTRSQAILTRQETELVLDLERHTYRIPDKARVFQLADDLSITLVTARSEVIAEEQGKIRFFPDGSSTGGRITLSSGTHKYIVDVDWLSGRVALIG